MPRLTETAHFPTAATVTDDAVLYVVDDPGSTPASKSMQIQKIVDHKAAYGSIKVDTNGSSQASSTSFAVVTAFDTDGATKNMTAAHGTDRLTITKAGDYLLQYQLTVSAGSLQHVLTQLTKGGVAIAGTFARETVAAASSMCSISGMTIVTLAAADYIQVMMAAGSGTPALTFVNGQLLAIRLS